MTATFTRFDATHPLAKEYRLVNGELKKKTLGEMVRGTFEVVEVSTPTQFAEFLTRLTPHTAISSSVPKGGVKAGRIVTKGMKRANPGALSRTKDDFEFARGTPGLLVIDVDGLGHDTWNTREEVQKILVDAVPESGVAPYVWWVSGSSLIYHDDAELRGVCGQRIWIFVMDASDIIRAGTVLVQRLIRAGHGRIAVSKAGHLLLRTICDASMFTVAKLDFAGGANCIAPLTQRRGKPLVFNDDALYLDTRHCLSDLNKDELRDYENILAKARANAAPEAERVKAAWELERATGMVPKLMAKGIPLIEADQMARQIARAALGGVLLGDFELPLDDGSVVTIAEILDNREKYHARCTLDPLEPDYQGGKIVGKLYLFGARANLFSFAHGGTTYRLRQQPARIVCAEGERARVVDELIAKLHHEPDIFLRNGRLVQVLEGSLRQLRAPALAQILGSRIAIYRRDRSGKEAPYDLPGEVINQVLGTVEVQP